MYTSITLCDYDAWLYISNMQYKDILQLMIDASGDSSEAAASSSSCPMDHASATGEASATEHKLTPRDIVGSSVTFLLAGYETTSSTLSFTSYLLTINPDIQAKLQSEIDSYFDDKPVRFVAQNQKDV